MNHVLAFGLGFSAQRLCARLTSRHWQLTGTSRNPSASPAASPTASVTRIPFDGTTPSPAVTHALATATHILVSIPPDTDGDPALIHHVGDIAQAPHLQWIGYLSTVGVYGDHQGGWVDETTPATPQSERAERRVRAEQAWLHLGQRAGKRVEIFRLPGIYGPGRSAIDTVRAGTARRIAKEGQVFNRVHVEDIAGALLHILDLPHRHAIYNVTDNEPSPPEDVVAYAAALLDVPIPPLVPFSAARLSPMAASFYAESKRVSNQRLTRDCGYTLIHPTYREGLTAILAADPR